MRSPHLVPRTARAPLVEAVWVAKDKGKFVGLLFPVNKVKNINGPPFLVDVEETTNTFSNYFRIVNLEKSNYSIKERADNEIFIEMIKNV